MRHNTGQRKNNSTPQAAQAYVTSAQENQTKAYRPTGGGGGGGGGWRARMEKVEKEKKLKFAKLTLDAPSDFAVKDTENDNSNNSNPTNSKEKNLQKNEERTKVKNNAVAASNDQHTYERPTQQEQRQQQQETNTPRTSYSNMTTKNVVFRSELTLTASIIDIVCIEIVKFCHDMAATQHRAWKHVIGVQAMSRKMLEVCFNLQDALHHIQTNGINTHNTLLTFTPDIPLVTTVSLWGIPIKMPEDQMNEHLQRYGEVKSSYQPRKNVAGNNILTGVRVYSIILKHPIPRNLQVGGMNIWTKYTGQDRHIQQE